MLNDTFSNFVYLRSYSRWVDELQRRENWPETVERYTNFMLDRVPQSKHAEFKEACEGILNMENMPSMRALWAAGKALERDNICSYNCAYTVLDHPKAFSEILYILLNGTGVGFSVERQYINRLPEVPLVIEDSHIEIVFADSKLGWAEGFHKYLMGLWNGKAFKLNYSKIRPRGARLKTFGGRASGPSPLKTLCDFTRSKFVEARGRKLNSLECHDIACYTAKIVEVGGVRRSAAISLSNLSDKRMAGAKMGEFWMLNPQRQMANNSVAYTEKPDVLSFLEECQNLIRSGSGERGIFNREAAISWAIQNGRQNEDGELDDLGTNPCLVGSTLIPVQGEGLLRIKDMAGREWSVRDGNGEWTLSPADMTAEHSKLVCVVLSDGSSYQVTPWHEFVAKDGSKVRASDLKSGDSLKPSNIEGCFGAIHEPKEAYLDAWLIADGTWYNNQLSSKLYLYEPKHKHRDALEACGAKFTSNPDSQGKITAYFAGRRTDKSQVPSYVLRGDQETILAFIKGSVESDGTICKTRNGWMVQFNSNNRAFLQEVQALLRLLGIYGKIALAREAQNSELPDGNGGSKTYWGKDQWRITVSNPLKLFEYLYPERVIRGHYKKERDIYVDEVVNLPDSKQEPVYCLGVTTTSSFDLPTVHSGNCGEVLLKPDQFCNLTEVIVRPGDDMDSLKSKVRMATILGVVQSTLTKFVFLRRSWKVNCERDRLLGVSLTGLRDHDVLGKRTRDAENWLMQLKQVARDTAVEWAGIMGINAPQAVTCIKPSGTVSTMAGSSSGIHSRHAPYYVRRVRVTTSDPLAKMMLDQGVPAHPEVGQTWEDTGSVVFEFSVKSPSESTFRDEETAIEQLNYWLMVKKNWCDHNPSATIYVRAHEWPDVIAWLNREWNMVCGLTFLPYDGGVYQLAPFEEISEEEYHQRSAMMPVIDFGRLAEFEEDDCTEGSREFACTGGGCELA